MKTKIENCVVISKEDYESLVSRARTSGMKREYPSTPLKPLMEDVAKVSIHAIKTDHREIIGIHLNREIEI